MNSPVPKALLLSISLLAASALAYEVLLTRLFAIIQWHHFAYMVISLALLGYGASGSFLALIGERAKRRFGFFFTANATFFAISLAASFLLAQQLPFNAMELAWAPRQLLYLSGQYLLLAVPFFCVANCFGLTFMVYREQIGRIYAADLCGAGVGALAITGLLFLLDPLAALFVLGVLALVAAVLFSLRLWWVLLAALPIVGLLPLHEFELKISDYKSLSQALRVAGSEHLDRRSSPLGLIDVLDNERIPFRYAPGLSLAATAIPGDQRGLFSDGELLGVLTRFDGSLSKLAYLDFLTSALPYHLLDQPDVLVLGAGGGADVLQALYQQARSVTAVELNPQIVALVQQDMADYTGRLYSQPGVQVDIAEARGFIAASSKRYDLIQIALLDTYSAAAAGLYAAGESYLYTVEALAEYLHHLQTGGLLSITRWQELPPRASLKLFLTALQALERSGINNPGSRVAMIRGWKTTTLIVKNGLLTAADIAALKEFCRQRSFDVAYYPGMQASEANRFNRLEYPYLYEAAQALLGSERDDFLRRYKFKLQPATDDRPFFYHFLKWSTLPELLKLQANSGFGQLEWGYLVLVAALLQAVIASVVLIILPLLISKPTRQSLMVAAPWRILAYFSAIGLGFLFLEIAFMQKFVLFLSHPLYAIAVVLCAFLVFAGLGSASYERFEIFRACRPYLIALAIVLCAVVNILLMPTLIRYGLAWPDAIKVLTILFLIAPLAFFMGMPFPLALQRLKPAQLPWAWAINGCASVISAVLATLLAIEIGFIGLILAAAVMYMLAGCIVPPLAGRAP